MRQGVPRAAGLAGRLLSISVLALAVASCGKPSSQTASSPSGPPAAQATSQDDTGEEAIALAEPSFVSGAMLHLGTDAYDASQKLEALNGSDPKQTYGAAYETTDYAPCTAPGSGQMWTATQPAQVQSLFFPSGQSAGGIPFADWLVDERIIVLQTYPITFPNSSMPDSAGGTSLTYTCAVVGGIVERFRPGADRGTDRHHGLDIPFAARHFLAWTYRNRYTTQIDGKGDVKVFAGTFTYEMRPVLPGVSFQGQGTANVKLMFNPDTGKWDTQSFDLTDPVPVFSNEPPPELNP